MADPFVGKAAMEPSRHMPDAEEVRRALAVLCCDPGGDMEVRYAPSNSVKVTGSFHRSGADIDGLARDVVRLNRPRHVYLCLNPAILSGKKYTDDVDVIRRLWLFLDIDSIRKDAKENCATEEEKYRAKQCADGVRDHLSLAGWADPVEVDSGNGYYLLYRIDLPNDEASEALVQAVLVALAEEFPGAKIDPVCYNASRIARIPGTWNRKGKDLKDRPWRMARLLAVPEKIGVVSREQLVEVAGGEPVVQQAGVSKKKASPRDPFVGKVADQPQLKKYVENAILYEVARVFTAIRGADGGPGANNALNTAAFCLGQLVARNLVDESEAIDKLTSAAERAGLEPEEIPSTINSGLRKGKLQPRKLPADLETILAGTPPADAASPQKTRDDRDKARADGRGPEIIRLDELMKLNIPEPRWAVPGILCEGLNILAGKPKLGKSWLALNLAITIAAGGKALGDVQTTQGDVLYLALEDRYRRLQNRAGKVLKGLGLETSTRLHFATEWPRQHQDGLGWIEDWIEKQSDARLVIIDVWARFRTPPKGSGSAYDQDYEQMSQVKAAADRHGISFLVLHHCRKGQGGTPEDILDEISGTQGIAGTADGPMVLARTRGENEATLVVDGRDVGRVELALKFEEESCCWKSLGPADKHTTSKVRQAVMEFFRKTGGAAMFSGELADQLNINKDTLRKELSRMYSEGILRKIGQRYAWPLEDNHPGEGEV